MQHPDSGDLALLALGIDHDDPRPGNGWAASDQAGPGVKPWTLAQVTEHAAGCDECGTEVQELSRAVDLAKRDDLGELPPPPPHVWAAIAHDLGLSLAPQRSTPGLPALSGARSDGGPDGGPDGGGTVAGVAASVIHFPAPSTGGRATTPTRPARAPGSGRPTRWGRGLDQPATGGDQRRPGQRSSRPLRVLLPLAAAIVIGVVGALIGYGLRTPSVGTPTVAASAALAAVPGGPGNSTESGVARLVRAPAGPRVSIAANGLPAVLGSYEVWLFGPDGRMVSLGVLDGGTGDFVVPHGIDVSQYRTIDISDEPADGNPAHSKVSVLRGILS